MNKPSAAITISDNLECLNKEGGSTVDYYSFACTSQFYYNQIGKPVRNTEKEE